MSHCGRGVSPRQASLINPSPMLLWKCDRELTLYLNNVADVGFKLLICFRYYLTWTWFVITLIHTLMDELYLWTLCNVWCVCWIMYDLGCMLVASRPFAVLNGLPGLYGFKYDSATACGLLLYLCSYKLNGSALATHNFYCTFLKCLMSWKLILIKVKFVWLMMRKTR